MGRTTSGAIAPPTDEPLSKKAVASPRSCFGNHSETALVAAGQLADSDAPSKKRKPQKLKKPLAAAVATDTSEYETTLRLSPRRVPSRSISLPRTVWPIVYATRKAITIAA